MKTNNKLSAYILRGSMTALLLSCVIVGLCSAINVPEQLHKTTSPQSNAVFSASRSLSFPERVAYQTAIEDVYWRHRIWPNTNTSSKPSLDAVMSQAQLEKKVEDYLRNSQALEDYWHRPASNASHPPAAMQQLRAGNDVGGPITADQLQAEMERIASDTRQPDVLQELFEALGNDPFVIAECLARPILSERLVREQSDVASGRDPAAAGPSRPLRSARPRRGEQAVVAPYQANVAYTLPGISGPSAGCVDDTWTATSTTNAPSGRAFHAAVWTGSEMIVWGGYDHGVNYWNTGGRYTPSTDSWTATSTTNAPVGRVGPGAVWTGIEMIVWGGTNCFCNGLASGGRYNPGTNSWTATTTSNAPTGRTGHTAVWTGSEMIVWGGWNYQSTFNTGGRYNANTNSWTPTSTTNAPSPRSAAAVWDDLDNLMIVYGGAGDRTGGRYNPSTDSWTATSTTNAPREGAAVWTGSEMIVWADDSTGGRYNPSTDSWTATSTTNAPDPRPAFSAVWTGGEMIVWGGFPGLNTGGRYDPSTDSWTATSTTNAPEPRVFHTAVSTDSEMIVWGGQPGSGFNTGGRYCAPSGSPTPTPTATATFTPTPTVTATATATATPSATARPSPTARPRPTPAPRP